MAQKCIQFGIAINFSAIAGFPGESVESIRKALGVAKDLRKMSNTFHMSIFYFKPYPGNKVADQLTSNGYIFFTTLEQWSNFDYVDSGKSEWIDKETIRMIENFKFYKHFAYKKKKAKLFLFQEVAKWRVENNFYLFPFEKRLKEIHRPLQKLS